MTCRFQKCPTDGPSNINRAGDGLRTSMPRRQPPPRYNVVVMLKEQHVKNQIPSHEHKLQLTRGIQETEKGIDVRFRHLACKTFSNAEQKPSRESIISVTVTLCLLPLHFACYRYTLLVKHFPMQNRNSQGKV